MRISLLSSRHHHHHHHHRFKTVVLAEILYATPAWWGFTSAADRQRIEAFVRRCVRLGLYRASDPALTQLIADNDDDLFRKMLYNEHHVL